MITLPASFAPRAAQPFDIAAGFDQRNARGMLAGRVEVPGSRFGVEITLPTMDYARAMELNALLRRARTLGGLRMAWPLMATVQGGGTGAVDGSGAAGESLPVRGLTPGFMIRRGYWVTVIDGNGARCLHNVIDPVRVAADGTATLAVQHPLRTVLADGDAVLVSRPEIEGMITSDLEWNLPVNRRIGGLGFRLEEVEAE